MKSSASTTTATLEASLRRLTVAVRVEPLLFEWYGVHAVLHQKDIAAVGHPMHDPGHSDEWLEAGNVDPVDVHDLVGAREIAGPRGRAVSLSGSGTGPAKTLAQSPVREESEWSRSRRRSWATLLMQIWLVDPLLRRCGGQMRIVAFIQDRPVIDKILAHIDYRLVVLSLPAVPRAPPPPEPDWNNQDYALPF